MPPTELTGILAGHAETYDLQPVLDAIQQVRGAIARFADIHQRLVSGAAWPLDRAREAAAAMGGAASRVSADHQQELYEALNGFKQWLFSSRECFRHAMEKLAEMRRSMASLDRLPASHVQEPVPAPHDPFAGVGSDLEHAVDTINTLSALLSAPLDLLAPAHAILSLDLVKDAIKADDTAQQLDQINTRLDAQVTAINRLIDAQHEYLVDEVRDSAHSVVNELADAHEATVNAGGALQNYEQVLQRCLHGSHPPSGDAQRVLATFNGLTAAKATADTVRSTLATGPLSRELYTDWLSRLVPLGQPSSADFLGRRESAFVRSGVTRAFNATAAEVQDAAAVVQQVHDFFRLEAELDGHYQEWMDALRSRHADLGGHL